jgi:hypothetical protein
MDLDPDILAHYAQGVEADRLTTWARLEAARTRELLRRFLPPAPAVVLDVGGAEAPMPCRWRARAIVCTWWTRCRGMSRGHRRRPTHNRRHR